MNNSLKYTASLPKGVKEHPKFCNYGVTKDGRIWSTISNKFLRPYKIKDGHLQVNLGSKNRHKAIHRLVLETYIGPAPPGLICRHLDGNPENNNLFNLEWNTLSINGKDRYKHGRGDGFNGTRGESHPGSKLNTDEVINIYYLYHLKIYYASELAKMFDVAKSTVEDIIYKRTWNHIWEN